MIWITTTKETRWIREWHWVMRVRNDRNWQWRWMPSGLIIVGGHVDQTPPSMVDIQSNLEQCHSFFFLSSFYSPPYLIPSWYCSQLIQLSTQHFFFVCILLDILHAYGGHTIRHGAHSIRNRSNANRYSIWLCPIESFPPLMLFFSHSCETHRISLRYDSFLHFKGNKHSCFRVFCFIVIQYNEEWANTGWDSICYRLIA